ncbi:c-Myc-binding protein-like [Cloeon dipterum]|uniref:c-Myc-binding protein-like n=1 Tax=Cloeon dipterum TaxID=197152 RepID=UPI00322045F8
MVGSLQENAEKASAKDEEPQTPKLLQIEEDTVGLEREEFRVYLEGKGVMESLIRAMTELFLEENKPDDPLDYIKSFLIERHRPEGDVSVLRTDLREARKKISSLKKTIASLTSRLETYEPVGESSSEEKQTKKQAK